MLTGLHQTLSLRSPQTEADVANPSGKDRRCLIDHWSLSFFSDPGYECSAFVISASINN